MQMTGRILGLVGIAALLSAPIQADEGLKERIEKRFHKAKIDQLGEVEVEVRGSAVVLTGFVTTLEARHKAEKEAQKESTNVEDRLTVVPEKERADGEILKDVQRAILTYAYYTIFDSISVGVDHGNVILEGSVLQPYRSSDIEARIGEVPGVRKVENKLAVQRVSLSDAELRRQLANSIYRNNLFDRYAIGANPPIHIVVDGGRVTLTGYVASPLEQAALGHIARQSWAFSVDNQVKVDGQKEEDRKPEATDN
jgi:hyperosmotically inducible protein